MSHDGAAHTKYRIGVLSAKTRNQKGRDSAHPTSSLSYHREREREKQPARYTKHTASRCRAPRGCRYRNPGRGGGGVPVAMTVPPAWVVRRPLSLEREIGETPRELAARQHCSARTLWRAPRHAPVGSKSRINPLPLAATTSESDRVSQLSLLLWTFGLAEGLVGAACSRRPASEGPPRLHAVFQGIQRARLPETANRSRLSL